MDKPVEVDNGDVTFGRAQGLMVKFSDIPGEFHSFHNPHARFISMWFYKGLDPSIIDQMKPASGIVLDSALRHIAALLKSFEPEHNHKIACCAYLLSKWIILPEEILNAKA